MLIPRWSLIMYQMKYNLLQEKILFHNVECNTYLKLKQHRSSFCNWRKLQIFVWGFSNDYTYRTTEHEHIINYYSILELLLKKFKPLFQINWGILSTKFKKNLNLISNIFPFKETEMILLVHYAVHCPIKINELHWSVLINALIVVMQ